MKGLTFSLVLLLPGLASLFAADVRERGLPVPAGAQASLAFKAGPDFVLGDTIAITFMLTNAGAQPFDFETGGDYRGTGFPTRYKVTVADEKGAALIGESWMEMGGMSGRESLQPGAVHRQELRLQNYVRVDRPGMFLVRVTHDFGWKATNERPLPSAEGKITIALPSAEQAAARVQALAGSEPTPVATNGRFADRPETDFRYLSHPVFLPALEAAAAAGHVYAFEGLHRIETPEATLALVRLLASDNLQVVHGAAALLSRRMPPRMVQGRPRNGGWFLAPGEATVYPTLWRPEAGEPLRAAARKLLRSDDVDHVKTGAFIVETIGTPEDGARVIEALGKVMQYSKPRANSDDNILDRPAAGDALTNALAGLRERGYRAPGGGVAAIYAQFLELADPEIPRRAGWENSLEAFFDQNPAMLREAAVQALPKPPVGKWAQLLAKALNDQDRGVMLQACVAAGESRNPDFALSLANIVRTEQQRWVVFAASDALVKLGADWAATDAWIERVADEKLYPDALRFLATQLEHPANGGSGGRTDLPRDARVALREMWRRFFSDETRSGRVRSGQLMPVTEAQARELFGGVFELSLEGGKSWPARLP